MMMIVKDGSVMIVVTDSDGCDDDSDGCDDDSDRWWWL